MTKAITLIAVALLIAVGAARGQSKEQLQAREELQASAERGDADAQFVLGFAHGQGLGELPSNFRLAAQWFTKAAKQGHAYAQLFLGKLYDKGEGVPQNYAVAVRWFREAAEQGHTYGQFELGKAYVEGRGVPQNYEEGYIWLNLASADPGDIDEEVSIILGVHPWGTVSIKEEIDEELNAALDQLTPDQVTRAQAEALRRWEEIEARKAGQE